MHSKQDSFYNYKQNNVQLADTLDIFHVKQSFINKFQFFDLNK